jgi:hypothetical protein
MKWRERKEDLLTHDVNRGGVESYSHMMWREKEKLSAHT